MQGHTYPAEIEAFQTKFDVDLHDFKDFLGYNPLKLEYLRESVSTLTSETLSDKEVHKFNLKKFLGADRNKWLYSILLDCAGFNELSTGIFYHPVKNTRLWSATLDLIENEREPHSQ